MFSKKTINTWNWIQFNASNYYFKREKGSQTLTEREAERRITVAAGIELSPIEQSPSVMNYQIKKLNN